MFGLVLSVVVVKRGAHTHAERERKKGGREGEREKSNERHRDRQNEGLERSFDPNNMSILLDNNATWKQ